jgi:hypothetical protein
MVHCQNVETLRQGLCFNPLDWTAASICAEVANFFRVTRSEVAMLVLKGHWLDFLHPVELSKAGAIHLTSSAVAARTVQAGKAELFNNFMQVPHLAIFELILIQGQPSMEPIQKLMTAPILTPEQKMWGVIQVSRKASELAFAGPDFTADDLEKLGLVAAAIGRSVATVHEHVYRSIPKS